MKHIKWFKRKKLKEQELMWIRKYIDYLLSNVKNWYELPTGDKPYEIK